MDAAISSGKTVEEVQKEMAKPEEEEEKVKEEEKEVKKKEKKEVKKEVKKEKKEVKKEVKKEKTVAMNAEGKPVRVDNNWKAFLSKTGGKKTSVKRKEAPVKVQREEKKGTLLDGFEEVHSRKKIPLVKKK